MAAAGDAAVAARVCCAKSAGFSEFRLRRGSDAPSRQIHRAATATAVVLRRSLSTTVAADSTGKRRKQCFVRLKYRDQLPR